MEGKSLCGICICLALRIMFAIVINWDTMTFPCWYYTYRFSVIYFTLELLDLNLNSIKGHMEFWGNLWCFTALYVTLNFSDKQSCATNVTNMASALGEIQIDMQLMVNHSIRDGLHLLAVTCIHPLQ